MKVNFPSLIRQRPLLSWLKLIRKNSHKSCISNFYISPIVTYFMLYFSIGNYLISLFFWLVKLSIIYIFPTVFCHWHLTAILKASIAWYVFKINYNVKNDWIINKANENFIYSPWILISSWTKRYWEIKI